jgi:WbqC-like protein
MRVAIYQPRYFPQLHYFHRILDSDTFVFFDSAQFTRSIAIKNSDGKKRETTYQSETPIKLSTGKFFLTVPVKHEGLLPINKVRIDYTHAWIHRHVGTLTSAFRNAPHFTKTHSQVKKILRNKYQSLSEFNLMTILWGISELLDFNLPVEDISLEKVNQKLSKIKNVKLKKILLASTLDVPRPEGIQKGTEWTTAICVKLKADECYYGKTGALNYMNFDYYLKHGITPIAQDFVCETYPQQFEKVPFIANLSILDLLYNVSSEKARKVLTLV